MTRTLDLRSVILFSGLLILSAIVSPIAGENLENDKPEGIENILEKLPDKDCITYCNITDVNDCNGREPEQEILCWRVFYTCECDPDNIDNSKGLDMWPGVIWKNFSSIITTLAVCVIILPMTAGCCCCFWFCFCDCKTKAKQFDFKTFKPKNANHAAPAASTSPSKSAFGPVPSSSAAGQYNPEGGAAAASNPSEANI